MGRKGMEQKRNYRSEVHGIADVSQYCNVLAGNTVTKEITDVNTQTLLFAPRVGSHIAPL